MLSQTSYWWDVDKLGAERVTAAVMGCSASSFALKQNRTPRFFVLRIRIVLLKLLWRWINYES